MPVRKISVRDLQTPVSERTEDGCTCFLKVVTKKIALRGRVAFVCRGMIC